MSAPAAYYRVVERLSASTAASLNAARSDEDALRGLVAGFVDLTFTQRELVAVYLVCVRPELSGPDARILVHAAQTSSPLWAERPTQRHQTSSAR